jgi:mono/diheme cytochrome c family protein
MQRSVQLAVILALIAGFAACDRFPGKPDPSSVKLRPSEVTNFEDLYPLRCAGCHGNDGKMGAARPMNDPLYLAVISDQQLTEIIAHGIENTLMPACVDSSGGALTHRQIDLIVKGMRERWATPEAFKDAKLPSYAVTGTISDKSSAMSRGAKAYRSACSRCHGPDGNGASAGSIVDPVFLSLVSNQALRSAVIFGRPDLGQPDYRTVDPSGPLTPRQIDDIVAWLASHRKRTSPES